MLNDNDKNFKEVSLFSAEFENISLKDALKKSEALPSSQIFLLAYSPTFCKFLTPNEIQDDIFELRAFCNEYELRWVREGNNGHGRAVFLSEKDFLSQLNADKSNPPKDCLALPGSYMTWQKFEHRVGKVHLPIPISEEVSGDVFIEFDELFSVDRYGNLSFMTELLKNII